MANQNVEVTLRIAPSVYKELKKLAKKYDGNIGEVFRNGIGKLKFLEETADKNSKILIKKKNSNNLQEVIWPPK